MNKVLLLITSVCFAGCYSHPAAPDACGPDTTVLSHYSFVDVEGNFIDHALIHRMYDACNDVGGYKLPDSCFNFNKIKVVSELLQRLKVEDRPLSRRLLNGEIYVCDTTDPTNHSLILFAPVEYDSLKRVTRLQSFPGK